MLINLDVYNGLLSPIFDSNNNYYTVSIENDIDCLDIFTETEKGYDVNIVGNENLQEGENTILIEVSNESQLNTYTLNVIKETSVTNIIYDVPDALEIRKELPSYVPSLIGIICFVLILFLYTLLFHKKRSNY